MQVSDSFARTSTPKDTMHTTQATHLAGTASGAVTDSFIGKTAVVVTATGLMALAAHISLPLPFSPVPLTLQTFAVLLIGMTLGPALGFSTMVLYLAEGAAGLPVFSPHGPGGIAQLVGPTAGFLFSYSFAAAMAGWLVRTLVAVRSLFTRGLAAGILASPIFFAMGALWLSAFTHLGSAATWHVSIAPFVPGEIIKIIAAATLFSSFRRWKQA
jgi:biotin transport system substrate-specific component